MDEQTEPQCHVHSGDLAGDGTGYSVSVENHYRTNPNKYGKKFVHFFSLVDLASGMCVGLNFDVHTHD